jgi:hypothetical protein
LLHLLTAGYVLWHFSAVPTAPSNVGYRWQTGHPQRSTSKCVIVNPLHPRWEGRMATHIRRRELIAALGGLPVVWPLVVRAQHADKARIGVIGPRPENAGFNGSLCRLSGHAR